MAARDLTTSTADNLHKCSQCSKKYPREAKYFHRDKSAKGGFSCRCKKCQRLYRINGPKENSIKRYSKLIDRLLPVKACTLCHDMFSRTTEYFAISKRSYDGLKYECKKCDSFRRDANRINKGKKPHPRKDFPFTDLLLPIKACKRCREVYPRLKEYFDRNPRQKDYLSPSCKICKRKYNFSKRIIKVTSCHDPLFPLKKCTQCILLFPRTTEYFPIRNGKNFRDGLYTWCKKCESIYQKKMLIKHKDSIRKSNRERYIKNHQTCKKRVKKWREDNPNKSKVLSHRKHSKRKGVPSTLTSKEWDYALQYWDNSCCYCGNRESLMWVLAMDHFISVSHPNSPGTQVGNVLPACHTRTGASGAMGCNNSKSATDPHTWLLSRFGARRARTITRRIEQYFTHVRARGDDATEAVGETRCEEDGSVYGIAAGD